jgi:hypothetical protein
VASTALDARVEGQKSAPRLVSIPAATLPARRTANELSSRALNVLKLLAPELTGKTPPRGRWLPTHALLQKLTMKRLSVARNCGPQTTDEIVKWAASQGVAIQPAHHAGKSLSAMWHDLETRFAAGALTKVEVTEALERSIRRKSVKIPLAFQIILLSLISSACE